MDLHLEQRHVDGLRTGDLKQFLPLVKANFDDLYRYVRRRGVESVDAEKIVRLTFIDALGQANSTPTDVSYLVWLFSLAKPRVWAYLNKSKDASKKSVLFIDSDALEAGEDLQIFVDKVSRMFGKLSLEELEIMRLKFFEELSDGEVMVVLAADQGSIGARIYRVLKRAHFLIFGESDEKQGVYFGELSGLLARIKSMEKIDLPEALKLSIESEMSNKLDRRDFAIDAELVEEKKESEAEAKKTADMVRNAGGSSDPAKIFVEAVRELKEEEELKKIKEQRREEKREMFLDFFDQWKLVLGLIPVLVFVLIVGFFTFRYFNFDFNFGKIARGFPTLCSNEVVFEGDFTDSEKRDVNSQISDRICEHFEVEELLLSRVDGAAVEVRVDLADSFLEYRFVERIDVWKIKRYEKNLNSDGESGEV